MYLLYLLYLCHSIQNQHSINVCMDDFNHKNESTIKTIKKKKLIDSVIATDVIYDTASIRPLFQTAASVLKTKGYFVLSHIPRASIKCGERESSTSSIRDEIEALILKEAENFDEYSH